MAFNIAELKRALVGKKIVPSDDWDKLLAEAKEKKLAVEDLLVPEPIARRHKIIAFAKEKEMLNLGMMDPEDLQTRDAIKKKSNLQIVPFLISKSSLEYGLKQYHTSLEAEFAKIVSKKETEETTDGTSVSVAEKLKEMAEEIPVVRVVDTLLEYAIFEKASDIHIEPQEKEVIVRYRIDGVLHDVMTLP